MYQALYADIASDDQTIARKREAEALTIVIDALTHAERSGRDLACLEEALDLHDKLWTIFLEDLADDENMLPQPVRAGLISVGLWTMRESLRVRIEGGALMPLVEINAIIRDGLCR